MKLPFRIKGVFNISRIDKRIERLGFSIIPQDSMTTSIVQYKREENNEGRKYTHIVELQERNNGHHVMVSYDASLFDVAGIGNSCVGLTVYEMFAFADKMKQLWCCIK